MTNMLKANNNEGFTLVEVMIVALILAVVLTGMIQLYIQTSAQVELSRSKTLAISEAQSTIEKIRNHAYADIVTDYGSGGTPGNTFSVPGLDAMGVVTIDNSNPDLLELDVIVSWSDKYNRLIGEDVNLNGQLDVGEDVNSNSTLDSPVRLKTMISRK